MLTNKSLNPIVGESYTHTQARVQSLMEALTGLFSFIAAEHSHRLLAQAQVQEAKARRNLKVMERIQAEEEERQARKREHKDRMGKSHAIRCGDKVWSKDNKGK